MKNEMIESIEDLYDQLTKVDEIKSRVSLEGSILSIVFHGDYKIEIVFKQWLYQVYINSIYFEGVEEQDVLDLVIEMARDTIIVQRKKVTGFKKIFTFIAPKTKFDRKKWQNIPDVKIFSPDGIIIDNF